MAEKQKHLEVLVGYEKLVALGGFVGEQAREMLYASFESGYLREAIEDTGGIDSSFWVLAEELQALFEDYCDRLQAIEPVSLTVEDIYITETDPNAETRALEQRLFQGRLYLAAVCVRRRLARQNKPFYEEWKVSHRLKEVLAELTPLEEMVFLGVMVQDPNSTKILKEVSTRITVPTAQTLFEQTLDCFEYHFEDHKNEREELNLFLQYLKDEGVTS